MRRPPPVVSTRAMRSRNAQGSSAASRAVASSRMRRWGGRPLTSHTAGSGVRLASSRWAMSPSRTANASTASGSPDTAGSSWASRRTFVPDPLTCATSSAPSRTSRTQTPGLAISKLPDQVEHRRRRGGGARRPGRQGASDYPLGGSRQARRPPKALKSRIGPVTIPEPDVQPAEGHEAESRVPDGKEAPHTPRSSGACSSWGSDMGYDVWVARNDRGRAWRRSPIASIPRLQSGLPRQFDERPTRRSS